MKLRCSRPVITSEGITDVVFYFDTESLELTFDDKYIPLMLQIYNKQAQDVPEHSIVTKITN